MYIVVFDEFFIIVMVKPIMEGLNVTDEQVKDMLIKIQSKIKPLVKSYIEYSLEESDDALNEMAKFIKKEKKYRRFCTAGIKGLSILGGDLSLFTPYITRYFTPRGPDIWAKYRFAIDFTAALYTNKGAYDVDVKVIGGVSLNLDKNFDYENTNYDAIDYEDYKNYYYMFYLGDIEYEMLDVICDRDEEYVGIDHNIH